MFEQAYAQEGEKPARVWSVKIEGNTTFEDIVIKKFISNESPSIWEKLTFFNEKGFYVSEDEIERDRIRIQRFYNRRGFDEASISFRMESKRKDWKKELIFEVAEGTPIRIDSVNVRILGSEKDKRIIRQEESFNSRLRRLPYREGRRYEPIDKTEVEAEIAAELRKLGYAYASAEVQASVDTLSKQADVLVLAYPGPRARFDNITVEGESTIDERYVVRETGIDKNSFFNDRAMRNAQREVFNHHLYRFALVSIPDQPQDSTLDVLVRVKEFPLRSLQLKLGAGNFDRIEGPVALDNFYRIFRGQLTWIYRNVRGKGERFTTALNVSGFEQRLGADYLFPYVFNTKSNALFAPFVQHKIEPSYEIYRGGMNSSFIYLYSQNLTGTFSYEFTLNNEVARKSQVALPDSILNYNVSSFSLNAYYTKGLREGRQGWILQPSVEFSGIFNEATFSFQKLALDVRKYTEINDQLVLATRARAGGIYFSKQDSLPNDIRFFTGGTNSVRGFRREEVGPKRPIFDENDEFERYVPVGGKAMLNFNVELRQDLNRFLKGFGVAGFLDGGQVWRSISNVGNRPIQYGTGIGLRYKTPIGPVRVDFAYKLNPTDEDLGIFPGVEQRARRWRFHFSIGQAF